MQDDKVMTQIGWNVPLSVPARLHDDVFGISGNCAQGWAGFPRVNVGLCRDVQRARPLDPELVNKSGTFFARPTGNRGPLLYNASKFRAGELAAKLTERQERFERQLAATGAPLPPEVLAAGEAKLADRGIPAAEVDEAEAQLRRELAESSRENRRLMSELRDMIGQLDEIQVLRSTHGV
ncbi:unnamed protein product [Prorocentrum cordatum]|uniref:Uncharacterized protein n=1 Tax=Prorocentrum cordatum TaxID=2364126 RepID=A0ABN9VGK0_9DINO|nr:unnamed protein product [Polarella glacialis]